MRLLLVLAAVPLAVGVAAAQPTLSGGVVFDTNGAGSAGGQFWNTRGGDGAFNLYLTVPNSGTAGAVLNPGDAAAASVSQSLPLGASQFACSGSRGWTRPTSG